MRKWHFQSIRRNTEKRFDLLKSTEKRWKAPLPVVLGICYLVYSEPLSYTGHDFTKFIKIFILITKLLYFLCIELNLQVDLLTHRGLHACDGRPSVRHGWLSVTDKRTEGLFRGLMIGNKLIGKWNRFFTRGDFQCNLVHYQVYIVKQCMWVFLLILLHICVHTI